MNKHTLKPGWQLMKFGDIAQNVSVRIDPAKANTEIYVGLEHLDPSTLHLRQWGHPSDVTGQKLVFKKSDVIFGRRRAYQIKYSKAFMMQIIPIQAEYSRLSRLWEALSPDHAIEAYEADYKWLTQVYESVKPPSGNGKLGW